MKLHRNETKSWFFNRGYPKTLIDTDFSKVKFLNSSWDKRTKGHEIPLVITYHPLLKVFSKFINKQVKKNIYSWSHGFVLGNAKSNWLSGVDKALSPTKICWII